MPSWLDINVWLYGVVSGLIAAIVILIRKVLTNEKQIDLLRQTLSDREVYRKERDERLDDQLSEIRNDIKALMRRV